MQRHIFYGFSGSLMNPPNRQKLWDDFNRSCILLPRLLPKSCRHNERFLSALVRLLFQAYLVLYRPKQGCRQGTAWRSSTLQDVRQNPSPALKSLKESPRMGTEFGCKICMLCADSNNPLRAPFWGIKHAVVFGRRWYVWRNNPLRVSFAGTKHACMVFAGVVCLA